MTLEAAITRAQALGLRVNNLFQLEDSHMWQANVCRGREAYAFSRDDNPAGALNAAIDDYEKLQAAVRRPARIPASSTDVSLDDQEDVFG